MRILILLLSGILMMNVQAQQSERIEVPKGVVYKYADSLTNAKARHLIQKELSDSVKYSMTTGILFVGPTIWKRYKKVRSLKKIEGGNMKIQDPNGSSREGKLIQNNDDYKLVWDHFRSEVGKNSYKVRKATVPELNYYWSVISFDINEPLFIVDTEKHAYILNLSAKDYTLLWLDEVPR